jgi:hypothetical protein
MLVSDRSGGDGALDRLNLSDPDADSSGVDMRYLQKCFSLDLSLLNPQRLFSILSFVFKLYPSCVYMTG